MSVELTYISRNKKELETLETKMNVFLESYRLNATGAGIINVAGLGSRGQAVRVFPGKNSHIERIYALGEPRGIVRDASADRLTIILDETQYSIKYNPSSG